MHPRFSAAATSIDTDVILIRCPREQALPLSFCCLFALLCPFAPFLLHTSMAVYMNGKPDQVGRFNLGAFASIRVVVVGAWSRTSFCGFLRQVVEL